MRGIFRDCCACACNGHIVVPTAKRTVKSRRLIWPLRSDALLSIVSLQPTLLKGFDVRFGSLADIEAPPIHVRFSPKSGHCRVMGAPLLTRQER
jgi:hypothetical protein